ncbi:unnamed protein product [Meloidogyne enterolobii]|uniref:Uncharacterized protein n=1 Tax=Meloidogyne enterolobii TaxID=390850 RepID=A0ACB0ZPW3_MELEN
MSGIGGRGPAWTNVELLAFCSAVEKKHEILFNTQKGANYSKTIEEAWIEIAQEMIEMGYMRFSDKNVKQLRGDIWSKKKEAVMKKYDISQKTGSGKTKWEEWEKVILRIVKRTKQADGLDISDSGTAPSKLQTKLLSEVKLCEIPESSCTPRATKKRKVCKICR